MKNKKHAVTLIDAEKAFDKIQHLFKKKDLTQQREQSIEWRDT